VLAVPEACAGCLRLGPETRTKDKDGESMGPVQDGRGPQNMDDEVSRPNQGGELGQQATKG
jgi:hypothetical protein